jgi:hypothetical protein
MRPIVVPLLLALAVGCARAPAPAESEAKSDAASAPVVASTVTDVPPVPQVSGAPCMPTTEGEPPPPFLPDTPAGVAQVFFEMLAPRSVQSVPNADELAKLAPMLTSELVAALERALAERDRSVVEHPGDKPPYLDGAMFVSLFEGFTQARPLTVATEGDQARVPVCFAYVDADGRAEWTDTVVLRKEGGSWRIDDVVYGGQWDFANTGTLRESLPRQP